MITNFAIISTDGEGVAIASIANCMHDIIASISYVLVILYRVFFRGGGHSPPLEDFVPPLGKMIKHT